MSDYDDLEEDDDDVGICKGCDIERPLKDGYCWDCTAADIEAERIDAAYEAWKERRWKR